MSYQALQAIPDALLALLISVLLVAGVIDMVPLRLAARRRRRPVQRKADESRARALCRPRGGSVVAWPAECPVRDRDGGAA